MPGSGAPVPALRPHLLLVASAGPVSVAAPRRRGLAGRFGGGLGCRDPTGLGSRALFSAVTQAIVC